MTGLADACPILHSLYARTAERWASAHRSIEALTAGRDHDVRIEAWMRACPHVIFALRLGVDVARLAGAVALAVARHFRQATFLDFDLQVAAARAREPLQGHGLRAASFLVVQDDGIGADAERRACVIDAHDRRLTVGLPH